MREIKLREWDGEKMYVMDKMYVGVGQVGFSDEHYVDLNDMDHEQVELMQYTGLKDKNGVEIYEGDILGSDRSLTPFTVSWKARHGLMWHNVPQTWSEYLGGRDSTEYEVLGNIFQNPDLLEKAA